MTRVLIRPKYCEDFRCVADKCKRSCCIGWEIDIDSKSAERFKTLGGVLGDELKRNILFSDEGACFILGENDRCPFLDKKGLCRLILEYGDGVLCDICREHPRYYNELPCREEMGIGLGCEEAARLILTDPNMGALCRWGDEPCSDTTEEELEEFEELLAQRDALLEFLLDESSSLEQKISAIVEAYALDKDDCLIAKRDILEFMQALEPLDDSWGPSVNELYASFSKLPLGRLERSSALRNAGGDRAYIRLLVYFIYRYYLKSFDSGYPESSYVGFAILSAEFITLRCSLIERKRTFSMSLEEICSVAADYSNQIEYCEENVEAIVSRFSGILG